MGMSITLSDVARSDAGRLRLHPTSLHLDDGQVVAIVGANGAGKSTLLSIMAAELAATQGAVLINDQPLASYGPMQLARERALMAQETPSTFAFTVADVVSWGRYCWRNTPNAAEDEARIAAALADQGITDLADRSITELSGGERARTHLARVLAQDAPMLFLDEADADLDVAGRAHLDDVVGAQRAAGRLVIMVSHDLVRVRAVADRVIAMHRGVVVRNGPTNAVLTAEVTAEIFGVPLPTAHRALGSFDQPPPQAP
jgi:iron complex transport system ATP-binding protein